MDTSIVETLNGWGTHHPWFADLAKLVAQDAVFLVVLVAAAAFLAAGRLVSQQGRRGAVSAAAALALALVAGAVVSGLVHRSRPFVDHPSVHLFAAHARDAGFPSDHATGAFAIAIALLLRHRLAGIVAIVLATLVAVGRVVIGVHYPTDVLGGAVIGGAAALVLFTPVLRRPLDALADRSGELYDRVLTVGRRGERVTGTRETGGSGRP